MPLRIQGLAFQKLPRLLAIVVWLVKGKSSLAPSVVLLGYRMSTQPSRIRFGAFELDLEARELRKSGIPIKLQPQPFKVLALLASRGGKVVTREELHAHIWGRDTFVDLEKGLGFCIGQIRAVLSDNAATPRYIETLPRLGYRFIAPVCQLEAASASTDVSPLVAPSSGGPAPARPRSARFLWRVVAGVVAILLGVAYVAWDRGAFHSARPAGKVTLVVMPFTNLSGDPAQEFLGDGLTEELIALLSRMSPEQLGVIGRTSSMAYKGKRPSVQEVSQKLGVDYLVEGSVHRSGDRVRVNAQLIRVPHEMHLWSQAYERDMRDVQAMQSDLGQAIAREIGLKLAPQWQARLAGMRPVSPRVYEAYLKGRYFWNKRTPQGLKNAIEYFQEAIEKDPAYAPAHAALADCYLVMTTWSLLSRSEAYPKAKAAASKALELDDTLAEAHASLAEVKSVHEWDWAGAESAYRRAIELDPNYATGRQWYAEYLVHMGRTQEGILEILRAQELDPLSLQISAVRGDLLQLARHPDQAVEQCLTTLKLDPNFAPAHFYLGRAYEQKGMFREAVVELRKALVLSAESTLSKAALGHAYAVAGNRTEAVRILEELLSGPKGTYVSPYSVAAIYAGLGKMDKAFFWLEQAYQQHDGDLRLLKVDPWMDPLRSDPRFQTLMRRMNFPP